MAQITSREEFEEWLKDKPAQWGKFIAVRNAQRVLPLAFTPLVSDKWIFDTAFPLFRALFIAQSATDFPPYGRAVEHPARAMIMQASNLAGGFAADAENADSPNMAIDYYGAANAVHAAAIAIEAAMAASAGASSDAIICATIGILPLIRYFGDDFTWEIMSDDINFLSAEADDFRIKSLSQPLWQQGHSPGWFDKTWAQAKPRLLAIDPSYAVWIEWYERRILGEAFVFDQHLEVDNQVIKKIDQGKYAFWEQEATVVNTTLQGWIDEARKRVKPALPLSQSKPNFFISYSTKEEAMAREVEAILSERGYTSIAQFKDFPQGNFVNEMQDGIASSERFIALQSKAYWDSGHCQSEWAAAYARDPGAKQRKIVPFLLEDITLPPLASELVYKPLFKLTEAERKQAIIDWIEFQPPSHSLEELRKTLADVASPTVTLTNNKLDAIPNAVLDAQSDTFDLAEAIAVLRALVGTLRKCLTGNSSPVFASSLARYDEELERRGAKPFIGVLARMEEGVEAQFNADPEAFDDGVITHFKNYFAEHHKFMTHYQHHLEREKVIAELTIDERAASGKALTSAFDAAAVKAEEMFNQGLITDVYRDEMLSQQANLKALEYSQGTAASGRAKLLQIVQSVGFLQQTLIASATIVATGAAFPEFIAVVKAAIAALSKFFV
jgi:hypothetical protein